METSSYDIYFQGEALEGFELAQVRQNMGKLFQANEQTLNALFSGKTVLLKKDLSKEDALKYQTQLKKAGAKIVIKAKRNDNAAAAPNPQPATTAPAPKPSPVAQPASAATASPVAQAPNASPWSLFPAGSDLLRPEERHEVAPVQVDISALSVAALSPMPQQQKTAPPPPDTSSISIAEVGVTLGTGERERLNAQARVPEVNFSVAEVGARIGDEHIDIPLPEPDLSQFSLAAAGARLGPEQKAPPPKAPDTSHLTVAPQK